MTNPTTSDFCIAVRQRRAVSEHRSLYQFMVSMLANGRLAEDKLLSLRCS